MFIIIKINTFLKNIYIKRIKLFNIQYYLFDKIKLTNMYKS